MEIFCNIKKIFTFIFDQFNEPLLNRSIHFLVVFKKQRITDASSIERDLVTLVVNQPCYS